VRDTAVRREVVWEVVPDGGPNPCGPAPTYAPCTPARSYHFVLAPASALPVVFVEQ